MAVLLNAGINVVDVLRTRDATLMQTVGAIADRALEIAAEQRQDLAIRLQNAIAKGMGG